MLRQRIAKIVANTVLQGTGKTSDGYSFYTFIPPSREALEEVQRNADAAVPILEEYLWGKDDRSGMVAMRLLGSLGGLKIVNPLQRIVETHPLPGFRSLALRWLTAAPWETVSPIVKKAAATDSDPSVRSTARDLLASHSNQ